MCAVLPPSLGQHAMQPPVLASRRCSASVLRTCPRAPWLRKRGQARGLIPSLQLVPMMLVYAKSGDDDDDAAMVILVLTGMQMHHAVTTKVAMMVMQALQPAATPLQMM